jgi:hypothetical protein
MLECWSVGVLECWSGGVLEWWSGGVVEWWSGGVLECWSVGVLEWWSGGVVEWWSDGVMECWSVGVMARRRGGVVGGPKWEASAQGLGAKLRAFCFVGLASKYFVGNEVIGIEAHAESLSRPVTVKAHGVRAPVGDQLLVF